MKLTTKIMAVGATMVFLGFGGIVVGHYKGDNWAHKVPGAAVVILGGLTCAGPDLVKERYEEIRKRQIERLEHQIKKYDDEVRKYF